MIRAHVVHSAEWGGQSFWWMLLMHRGYRSKHMHSCNCVFTHTISLTHRCVDMFIHAPHIHAAHKPTSSATNVFDDTLRSGMAFTLPWRFSFARTNGHCPFLFSCLPHYTHADADVLPFQPSLQISFECNCFVLVCISLHPLTAFYVQSLFVCFASSARCLQLAELRVAPLIARSFCFGCANLNVCVKFRVCELDNVRYCCCLVC